MLESRLAYGLLSILCFSLAPINAGEPAQPRTPERSVELFTAIARGEITAEVTAPSPREVWLRVVNKTDDQLKIELPRAFAAVPVLGQAPAIGGRNNFGPGPNLGNAQFGNAQFGIGQGALGPGAPGQGALGPGGLGQGAQGQGGQGLGGGFPGGGGGIGNLGIGGGGNVGGGGNWLGGGAGNRPGNPAGFQPGMFRVPAGRVGKIRAQTVCLEHGKPDPNSRMRYRIVSVEEFSDDPRIALICQLLGNREITQNVAQAAAWHTADGLSWDQLAAKQRVRSKYVGIQRLFTLDELEIARQVTDAIETATAPVQPQREAEHEASSDSISRAAAGPVDRG